MTKDILLSDHVFRQKHHENFTKSFEVTEDVLMQALEKATKNNEVVIIQNIKLKIGNVRATFYFEGNEK